MRWFVLLLLAGCAAPAPAEVPDAQPEPVSETPTALPRMGIGGTRLWHDPAADPLAAFNAITQSHVNPCVWTDDGEVYFNNMPLGGIGLRAPVPNGTSTMKVLLDWAPQDYVKDRLVIAYQPPGRDGAIESPWIMRAEETLVELIPSTEPGTWAFWACVSRAGSDTLTDPSEGPKLFAGELTYSIELLPA